MDLSTQFENALSGIVTNEMERVAEKENFDVEKLLDGVSNGRIIIMVREGHEPLGIGEGLSTKINVNLGTSTDDGSLSSELEKVRAAEEFGGDTISDLSMGGDVDHIRGKILEASTLPVTTVPIYQSIIEAGGFRHLNAKKILEVTKKQSGQGISSMVLHAGFDLDALEELRDSRRVVGMVSKGGSITATYMLKNNAENPFLENFDDFLEILHKKDIVLSLGNAMRSGCIHDSMDLAQKNEIKLNEKLARRANQHGVQVIVEGIGGHVNPGNLAEYIKYQKSISSRPLFIAGPLPTDIAVGHDHIAGSIGAAMASGAGADYLCVITPAEHLNLPSLEDVRNGIIAYKIAAHIGDTMKYGLSDRDLLLSRQRKKRNWAGQFEFAIDPEGARSKHPEGEGTCTMCGKYCAKALMEDFLYNS